MRIPKPLVQMNQLFIVTTVLLGLIFQPNLLMIPFLIGAYTLATKKNPVMAAGKRFLKKPFDQYVPEDRDQQLFNQWIATICLGAALLSFNAGWAAAGYVFSLLVVAAAGLALAGFCIGCTIRYRYMMWKHKRAHS
ncbi:DUF4395 domain-containing protein [Halobacillus campisalis]|uniref:DUF4395 domain-containing protein n=1 Tax=Halobacillus campisalis TaxID=435909 RepID=A0ABW2JYY6_9BACI|nr:DUF4395 domain-containing protein [Halobacillus campisalis]